MKASLPPADAEDLHGADSVKTFARKHALSRDAIYAEIASGRLIARKVGARTIITREDAARWRRSLPKMSAKDSNGQSRIRARPIAPRREDAAGREPSRRKP
jgi:hypothetical protein